MKNVGLILLLVTPLCFGADVYQCDEGGKRVFSEQPCAGHGKKLELGQGSVVSQQADHAVAATAAQADMTAYVARRKLAREIRALETERDQVARDAAAQIRRLQERGRLANNNLAGATWQQSLAAEMSAITAAADSRVSSIDAQLVLLQGQLEKIRE